MGNECDTVGVMGGNAGGKKVNRPNWGLGSRSPSDSSCSDHQSQSYDAITVGVEKGFFRRLFMSTPDSTCKECVGISKIRSVHHVSSSLEFASHQPAALPDRYSELGKAPNNKKALYYTELSMASVSRKDHQRSCPHSFTRRANFIFISSFASAEVDQYIVVHILLLNHHHMGILSLSPSRSRPWGREDQLAIEKLKRNRRAVDGYLRKMKTTIGKGLVLKDGICCFMHGRFVVVIEVPDSDPCKAILSTCVYQIADPKRTNIFKKCSKWSNLHEGIDGSSLDVLGDDEVNFCLEIPLEGNCSYHEFRDRLVAYLKSAVDINRALSRMDTRS
eukprot:scaffold162_cov176-Amphora_coffeaeformis.AAC.48